MFLLWLGLALYSLSKGYFFLWLIFNVLMLGSIAAAKDRNSSSKTSNDSNNNQ